MMDLLKENDLIMIDSKQFCIDRFISRGSSFVTYMAFSKYGKKFPYLIKEYLPLNRCNNCKRIYHDKEKTICVGIDYNSEELINKKNEFDKAIEIYAQIINHSDETTNNDAVQKGKFDLYSFVVPYYDFLSSETFIAIEYNEGTTLSEFFEDTENYTFVDFIDAIMAVAEICKLFLNTNEQFVCFDLKPDNLFIKKVKSNNQYNDKDIYYSIRFIDYDSFISLKSPPSSFLTSAGYAPPEFYPDENDDINIDLIDESSVVYTLGALLFHVCFPQKLRTYLEEQQSGYVEMPVDFISSSPRTCFDLTFNDFGDSFDQLRVSIKSDDENNKNEEKALDIISKNWLFEIWRKSINPDQRLRYNSIDEFIENLSVLKRLSLNEGVIPQVILKNIIDQHKEIDIIEDILTSVEPIP